MISGGPLSGHPLSGDTGGTVSAHDAGDVTLGPFTVSGSGGVGIPGGDGATTLAPFVITQPGGTAGVSAVSRTSEVVRRGLVGWEVSANNSQTVRRALVAFGGIPTRGSQFARRALVKYDIPLQSTQVTRRALVRRSPCVSQRAMLYTIRRKDGLVLRFTSWDEDITFGGVTFDSCGAMDPSAAEQSAETDSSGSLDLTGLLTSDKIREDDLYGGLYADAFVEAWQVDLMGVEPTRRKMAGWVANVQHGDSGFKLEIVTVGGRLSQRPLLTPMTPKCRYKRLGADLCPVDAEALRIAGEAVTSVTDRTLFRAAGLVDPGGVTWPFGLVRWLTGDNAGTEVEIKAVDFGAGTVETWLPHPFAPTAGDTFDLVPGCAQDKSACLAYGAYASFGGFNDIPGTDKLLQTPAAKV